MVSAVGKTLLCLLVAVLVLFALESVASACPTCKDSLAGNDPEHANLVRGYFWSILFMMSMPFLILSGLATLFYLEVRRARLNALAPAPVLAATAKK